MTFRLTKHHGLGNDFLVLLGPTALLAEVGPEQARAWCDRRRGVGADGLLLGTTEPLDPRTFPKRTIENVVAVPSTARACRICSHILFEAPMTFVGRTALSVLIRMNWATPARSAARQVCKVPKMLFRRPSIGFASTSGTCL